MKVPGTIAAILVTLAVSCGDQPPPTATPTTPPPTREPSLLDQLTHPLFERRTDAGVRVSVSGWTHRCLTTMSGTIERGEFELPIGASTEIERTPDLAVILSNPFGFVIVWTAGDIDRVEWRRNGRLIDAMTPVEHWSVLIDGALAYPLTPGPQVSPPGTIAAMREGKTVATASSAQTYQQPEPDPVCLAPRPTPAGTSAPRSRQG